MPFPHDDKPPPETPKETHEYAETLEAASLGYFVIFASSARVSLSSQET
jgi:hypothetical protein